MTQNSMTLSKAIEAEQLADEALIAARETLNSAKQQLDKANKAATAAHAVRVALEITQ